MPVRDALVMALQMARALAFAHGRGLIHRDVKPQNVLLNADGQAKMTDFGIAREVNVQGVTVTGTVLGTSEYIAPEQARGQQVDSQTDVYSLGVVLYELLTGGVPYDGDNFVTVALRHVNDPVPSVLERGPDTPTRVALAVERAMAKSPDERYGSMDELVEELEACLAELDPVSEEATMIARRPVGQSRERPKRRRRRLGVLWPIAAVLAVLAVGVLAALGALALRDGDANDPQAAPNQAIRLTGIGAFDPQGGDGEHDDEAPLATDGDMTTYWTTERYNDFERTKEGVGLVLDARRKAGPDSITVRSSTPGFEAEIMAGDSPEGPFEPVSDSTTVSGSTRFDLRGREARYFVVWITALDGSARVNEVTAR
jgi:eukaryotic-like serine/threonine-protein kinase